MDFDRAQEALEALQMQCPTPSTQEIGVWIDAITRAREVLLELQIREDKTVAGLNPMAIGLARAGIEPTR